MSVDVRRQKEEARNGERVLAQRNTTKEFSRAGGVKKVPYPTGSHWSLAWEGPA